MDVVVLVASKTKVVVTVRIVKWQAEAGVEIEGASDTGACSVVDARLGEEVA